MDARENCISVLMLPWLAHGHISPFLELAKKLTKRNFFIYLCSTPINLNSIKKRLNDKESLSIQLVELHLPSLPDLPPHYHTTNGLPTHLMTTLKQAFEMSSPNFSNILKTLKPNLLINDCIQPWASSIASSQNIPSVQFLIFGTAFISFVVHMIKNPRLPFPFSEIYLHEPERSMVQSFLDASVNGVTDGERFLQSLEQSCNVVLIKCLSREIERKYMDYSSVLINKKMVSLGPLVQNPVNGDECIEIMQWLDKKDESSSVFVCFGSEYFLSGEEMEELAYGLELSKVNFIWVVRFPMGERIRVEEALPGGYLERVRERGMVVEGWAPQAKILGHSSTGGFVSHCGWSSIMESMKYGVPIIGMPMQFDQQLNARLVEEIGVGVEVKRKSTSERLEREEIAEVVRKVVVEKNGENIRSKAREMSEHIRPNGEEEMDGVAEEFIQLCKQRK